MKLGANEPKKVVVLGVLLAAAGYLVYTNLLSGPSQTPPRPAAPPEAASVPATPAQATPAPGEPARPAFPRAPGRGRNDDFHPVLHSRRPEERIDTSRIDPTLRLDLLAKLQDVEIPGAGRNPFKMGAPPPKPEPLKGPEPKVDLKPPQEAKAPPAPPPGPPPPPPINLKYYGFSSAPGNNARTAFFLDGEDILMAKEGDTVKRKYRLVRIGVNSVVMEDTDSKRQQTLPLAEEAG
jgi:hypothetical protein